MAGNKTSDWIGVGVWKPFFWIAWRIRESRLNLDQADTEEREREEGSLESFAFFSDSSCFAFASLSASLLAFLFALYFSFFSLSFLIFLLSFPAGCAPLPPTLGLVAVGFFPFLDAVLVAGLEEDADEEEEEEEEEEEGVEVGPSTSSGARVSTLFLFFFVVFSSSSFPFTFFTLYPLSPLF